MVDGVDQIDDESGVAETALGGREFRGAVEHRDPMAPELKPAPEGVPEKFWDPIKGELRQDDLLKSYSELEKKIGAPKDADEEADEDAAENPDEADRADDEDGTDEGSDEENKDGDGDGEDGKDGEDDEDKDGADDGDAPALTDAIEAAQAVYAETGELPDEARAPLREAGITDEQIDFYLAGVKATEAALMSAATQAAGSDEDLQAAMQWAAQGGLSKKQILAFNAQMGDAETVGPAVAGLMTAFRAAEPGEGRLTNKTTGHSTGDVYGHMDEFTADLDRADQTRDKVARRKAIEKLRRSRAAGTIKSERRSPFGG